MFGNEQAIRSVFPDYHLEYRELDYEHEVSYRFTSEDSSWSGNIYDFYFKVCYRLSEYFTYQFRHTPEEAEVAMALKEALANCIVNADYNGQGEWPQPVIRESFHPDRITLILTFDEDNLNMKPDPPKWDRRRRMTLRKMRKDAIIDYVTRHVTATADDIAELLMIRADGALQLIQELCEEQILVTETIRGKTTCRLKS